MIRYVRSIVRTWEEFEVSINGWEQKIKLTDSEDFKSVGFLEVYNNLKDFKALYPNEDPIIMEVIPMEGKKYKKWVTEQAEKEEKNES